MSSLNISFESTEFSNTALSPSHPEFQINPANKHAKNPGVEYLLHTNYNVNERTTYGIIRPHLNLIELIKSCSEPENVNEFVERFEIMLQVMSYNHIKSKTASKDPEYNVFDQIRYQLHIMTASQSDEVCVLLEVIKRYTDFLEEFAQDSLKKENFSRFWNNEKPIVEAAVLNIIKTRLETGDTKVVQPVAPLDDPLNTERLRERTRSFVANVKRRSYRSSEPDAPRIYTDEMIEGVIKRANERAKTEDLNAMQIQFVQPVEDVLNFNSNILRSYQELKARFQNLPQIDELINSNSVFSNSAVSLILEFKDYFERNKINCINPAKSLKAQLSLLKFMDEHFKSDTGGIIDLSRFSIPESFINTYIFQELNNILRSFGFEMLNATSFLMIKDKLSNAIKQDLSKIMYVLAGKIFKIDTEFIGINLNELIRKTNQTLDAEVSRLNNNPRVKIPLAPDAVRYSVNKTPRIEPPAITIAPIAPEKFYPTGYGMFMPVTEFPPYLFGVDWSKVPNEVPRGPLLGTILVQNETSNRPPSPIRREPLEPIKFPIKAEGVTEVTEVNYTDFLSIIEDVQTSFQEGQASKSEVDLKVVDLSKQGIEYLYKEAIGGNIDKMALGLGLAQHIFDREGATSDALKAVSNLERAKAFHEGQDEFLNDVAIEVLEKDVLRAKARKAGIKWVLTQLVKDYFKVELIEKFARFLGKLTRK